MKQNLEQLSMFEDIPDEPVAKEEITPKECPHLSSRKHQWWDSRNTSLCHEAIDCSHCHILAPFELNYKCKIANKRGKNNVFYCKHVVKDTDAKEGFNEFANKCELTGNKWKSKAWSIVEDYNTNPINTPCTFCDLKSCDCCIFKKEVSEEHPYGCCGSCAYRLYCRDSKHKDVGTLTPEAFLSMAEDKRIMDGYVTDLSKGKNKQTYQSNCPNYLGYLCNGSSSIVKCSCTEKQINTDIFTAICVNNHEVCPLYKNGLEKDGSNV